MMSLIFALFSTVHAVQPPITSYDCTIAIFAKDLLPTGSASMKVIRPYLSPESHGGTPIEFTAGKHKVGFTADAKWRGIIWQRAGKDVAQVLTAGTQAITGNHVIILNNPADLEEAIHLECNPLPGQFPNQ